MKTPIWESSAGALEALLQTNNFVEADLYTYTAPDSATVLMRATDADINVTVNGVTWLTGDPVHGPVGSSRPTGHWAVGLDVDSWQIRVNPQRANPVTGAAYPALLLGKPWIQSAVNGALDGAGFRVDRAYFPNWSTTAASWGSGGLTPTGMLNMFNGIVVNTDMDQGGVIITANDWRINLDIQMPRNLFSLNCRHILYDAGCSLSRAAYTLSGTVGTPISRSSFSSAVAAPPGSGTYALGLLRMTSGQNSGFTRFIKSWDGSTFKLLSPLPYDYIAGTTFEVSAGCDKAFTTCQAFANEANWGGQQFIPAPEMAI